MKIRNMLNYTKQPGEVNDLPSRTVPDQTLTLKQILERYARGLPIDSVTKLPVYDSDPENNPSPDLTRLDFADRREVMEAAKSELDSIKQKVKQNSRSKSTVVPGEAPGTEGDVEGRTPEGESPSQTIIPGL